MKKIIVFSLLLTALQGCEKGVDFKLAEVEEKLVVEATIENNEAPVVVLSRSLNYFSKISPQLLAGSFVHNAEIVISDGTKTHQLKEYSVPAGNGYTLYYYSIDSAQLSTAVIGKLKTTYTIKVLANGKEYRATTTIPDITKRVDSLWWKPLPNDTSGKKAVVMVKATDPVGFGDYVRYWTKRNREPFLPGFTSVYDDLVIDGTSYVLVVEPGVDRNGKIDFDDPSFDRGDTVTLKLSNIDKATYDFWRTMEYTYASVGNPFSSPIKVMNNISNGALGYFGGYASQYKTVIIPK